jgi:hypothetical protein
VRNRQQRTFACCWLPLLVTNATQLMPGAQKQGRQKCNAKATGDPCLGATGTRAQVQRNLCPVRISKGGKRGGKSARKGTRRKGLPWAYGPTALAKSKGPKPCAFASKPQSKGWFCATPLLPLLAYPPAVVGWLAFAPPPEEGAPPDY